MSRRPGRFLLLALCAGACLTSAAARAADDEPNWPDVIAQLRRDASSSYPASRTRQQLAVALNNYGIQLGEQGKWALATDHLQEAIRLQPDDPKLRQNLATLYVNHAHAQYQERAPARDVLRLLDEALTLNPDLVEAYVLKGEVHYGAQQLKEAKVAWEEAQQRDAGRPDVEERLARLQQELPVEGQFDRISQAYFDLRFEEGAVERPTGFDIRDALLQARREVGTDFAYWPKYKLVALIYTSGQFRALRQSAPEWVGGLFDGKIRVPLPGDDYDASTVKQILYHEYTHALVHDLAMGKCPVWFNEGLAEYEGARAAGPRFEVLQSALTENRLVPWEQLDAQFATHLRAEQVTLGYQQAHSIVRHLVTRYGFWRIRRVLKALGEGASLETALLQEYRLKLARLQDQWRASLTDLGR